MNEVSSNSSFLTPRQRAYHLTPERPQPPASCPVVCVESAHGLVLSWSGPCYDGGSAVLGYVVEAKSESGGWSELTGQCESTSYRVSSGLQPRRGYSFRVRAYNAVGASEPGPESPEVTMEGKGEATRVTDVAKSENKLCITAVPFFSFFFFI